MNNAGTAIPKGFEETTLEEMDRVTDISGVFVATQAALKHMKSGGLIIMIDPLVRGRAHEDTGLFSPASSQPQSSLPL